MSDATGKIIGSMFLNGLIHTILPAIGISAYMNVSKMPELQSNTAFFTVLCVIVLGSFIANLISFMIVQSSVCGKIFQSEHLATLAGYSVIISVVFFSLSWHVDFIGNIIRNLLPVAEENSNEPETPVKNQFGESIVHAFYMFWAGMYSSASLSWFATACPLPSTDSKAT
ncbi:MAG: hypothetical protein EBY22_02755 [Gammaproteobacteria bacterium]|nr:hypothetical protein [Gammaproteobacteria bacterium]